MSALPHNLEAEQALIGALMFDNGILESTGGLRASHFFDPVHARIFSAIEARIRAGGMADGISTEAVLGGDRALDVLGGARRYLMILMERAAPLRAQAISYAQIIQDTCLRREIIIRCDEAISFAHGAGAAESGQEVLLNLQRALSETGEDVAEFGSAWRSVGEIAVEAVERAYQGRAMGISTGLPKLDEFTGGGRPGSLWVVGGATSMGKSVGGQQLAVNVARQGYGVAYIHLEMDYDEVGLRLASALAWDFRRINKLGEDANPYYLSAANQKLRPPQWDRMRQAAATIAPDLKIFVDDRPGRTLAQIEAATRNLFQKMEREGVKPGLIVVDHEGLIASDQKHPSLLEAATARGNGLKDMAKRLNTWTVTLAQLTNDGARADGDERLPTSQDLKYGGALTQAAHVVLLLHRKAYYAERKPHASRTEDDLRASQSREATIIVDKARGGRRGHIEAIMDVASAVLIESGGGL